MSDWQVGDLALCVAPWGNWTESEPFDPQPGSVNTVCGVISPDPTANSGVSLWFVGVPSCDSYDAGQFRKIRPHTPDAEDAETISLLNRQPFVVET